MKIINKMKLIKHWELNKSRYYVFVILLIVFIIFLLINTNIDTELNSQLFKDPGFIGIFGSLLGAIVGGIMSVLASIYVYKQQTKSKSFVMKMNIIYKPLYDELTELKSILDENPFPSYFRFEKGPQTIIPHPQFNAWSRIKSDSRYILVPNYIKEAFESFEKTIFIYLKQYHVAASDIQNKINEILFNRYNTNCTIQNLGTSILGEVLTRDDQNGKLFSHYFDHALRPPVSISDVELSLFTNIVFDECNNLESAINLNEAYNDVLLQQSQLVFCISSIIEIINIKYEDKSRFY